MRFRFDRTTLIFTPEAQFDYLKECYLIFENACALSSGALEGAFSRFEKITLKMSCSELSESTNFIVA